jgi:parvulin-like peptidyl-prolyl isomerase
MRKWIGGVPFTVALGLAACAAGDPVVLSVGPKNMTVSQFEESFWDASARDSTLGPDLTGLQKHADDRVRELLIQILAEEAEPELEDVRQDRLEGHLERSIVDHLRDVEYGDAFEVSEKDREHAYELLGTRRHVHMIQLATEAEAREIQRALREGATFSKVAEQRSLDSRTKAAGGDLGWLVYTDLDARHRDEVFSLGPGERTGILPHGETFVIYQVDELYE